jgi:hypothetical protein
MVTRADTCRSCGAEVEWATWDSGKAMPVDIAPDPKGKLVVFAGKVRVATPDDDKLKRERRTSHFATCPNSDMHRKR